MGVGVGEGYIGQPFLNLAVSLLPPLSGSWKSFTFQAPLLEAVILVIPKFWELTLPLKQSVSTTG